MAAGTRKSFSTTTSPTSPSMARTAVATGINVSSTQSECDSVDITGWRTLAVKPPASVTSLTFYAAETIDGTYVLIQSLGTAGAVTVVASVWNVIDPTKIGPFRFIQMVSNQTVAAASLLAST